MPSTNDSTRCCSLWRLFFVVQALASCLLIRNCICTTCSLLFFFIPTKEVLLSGLFIYLHHCMCICICMSVVHMCEHSNSKAWGWTLVKFLDSEWVEVIINSWLYPISGNHILYWICQMVMLWAGFLYLSTLQIAMWDIWNCLEEGLAFCCGFLLFSS